MLLPQQVIEQPFGSLSGATKSRKAIPKDVRAHYKRLYGVSHEAILIVPAGTSKAQAKALRRQWLAERSNLRVAITPEMPTPIRSQLTLISGTVQSPAWIAGKQLLDIEVLKPTMRANGGENGSCWDRVYLVCAACRRR